MFASTADGVELWYEQTGTGSAVLLIPGQGDSSDRYPARAIAPLVAAEHRVIRFDPRDTGLSGDGGDRYTLSAMADDAMAVLDTAEVTSAHLVGVSMGGLMLADLAWRRPDRVTSLAFISAMSPDPDAGMGDDFLAEVDDDPLQGILRAMGDATEDDRRWAQAELARSAARADRPDAGDRHMDAAMRFGWPELAVLDEITVPTLVIHGDADRVLPPAHATALHDHIAGSALVMMPGMGHLPRPGDWDVIADHLVRHLATA